MNSFVIELSFDGSDCSTTRPAGQGVAVGANAQAQQGG
jgi:hypothetical protein